MAAGGFGEIPDSESEAESSSESSELELDVSDDESADRWGTGLICWAFGFSSPEVPSPLSLRSTFTVTFWPFEIFAFAASPSLVSSSVFSSSLVLSD